MVEYIYTCDRCGIKQFGGKNEPPPQWYIDKDSERMQDEFLIAYDSARVHLCPNCARELRKGKKGK